MKAKSKILVGAAMLAIGSTAVFAATVTVGGWATVDTGTGNSATGGVIVTAIVQPTLSMVISSGAIALGDLSTSAYATGSVDIEVGTNAKDGVTVTAASGNSGLSSVTASGHTISSSGLLNEGYTFDSILGVTDSVAGGTRAATAWTAPIFNTAPVTVYTDNKPEKAGGAADATFIVSARIDEETPAASDYTDTITFTVTGTY